MDKSNHRVTVDRKYLEILEEFYEENKDAGFNIFGKHVIHMIPYGTVPIPQREEILFLNLNEVTDRLFDKIIVVDSHGAEHYRYVVTEGTRINRLNKN